MRDQNSVDMKDNEYVLQNRSVEYKFEVVVHLSLWFIVVTYHSRMHMDRIILLE